jgi:hypothetical protein
LTAALSSAVCACAGVASRARSKSVRGRGGPEPSNAWPPSGSRQACGATPRGQQLPITFALGDGGADAMIDDADDSPAAIGCDSEAMICKYGRDLGELASDEKGSTADACHRETKDGKYMMGPLKKRRGVLGRRGARAWWPYLEQGGPRAAVAGRSSVLAGPSERGRRGRAGEEPVREAAEPTARTGGACCMQTDPLRRSQSGLGRSVLSGGGLASSTLWERKVK